MQDNNIKTITITDPQTKRQVHTSALTNFRLAGWENFQDSLYTESNKRTIPESVDTKIEFNQPVLFSQFDKQPRIGSKLYPIYDFTEQKIVSYPENDLDNCYVRFQVVVEAQTNATGVGVECSLVIPNYLTIYKESASLIKGTNAQRISFKLPFYYDQNTIDNGVEIWIKPIGDDIQVYDATMYVKNW